MHIALWHTLQCKQKDNCIVAPPVAQGRQSTCSTPCSVYWGTQKDQNLSTLVDLNPLSLSVSEISKWQLQMACKACMASPHKKLLLHLQCCWQCFSARSWVPITEVCSKADSNLAGPSMGSVSLSFYQASWKANTGVCRSPPKQSLLNLTINYNHSSNKSNVKHNSIEIYIVYSAFNLQLRNWRQDEICFLETNYSQPREG